MRLRLWARLVLGVLLFTPRWARAQGAPSRAPPRNPADFGAFAFRAAKHFGIMMRYLNVTSHPHLALLYRPETW